MANLLEKGGAAGLKKLGYPEIGRAKVPLGLCNRPPLSIWA